MAHSGTTKKGRNYPSTPGHPNRSSTLGTGAQAPKPTAGSQRSARASSVNKGQQGMAKRNVRAAGRGRRS